MDDRHKYRLLVIDDDPEFLGDLVFLLSSEYNVSAATNTRDAAEMLRELTLDCILVDLNMPSHFGDNSELEGIAFLKYIRSNPYMFDFRALPVIIITANTDPETERMAGRSGANYFFSKPPNIRELNEKIIQAINAQ